MAVYLTFPETARIGLLWADTIDELLKFVSDVGLEGRDLTGGEPAVAVAIDRRKIDAVEAYGAVRVPARIFCAAMVERSDDEATKASWRSFGAQFVGTEGPPLQ